VHTVDACMVRSPFACCFQQQA